MKPRPLTQRAYAEHRKSKGLSGATQGAVSQAVAAGRLKRCLTRDGKIRDAALADLEWAATTKAEMRPRTGPAGGSVAAEGEDGTLGDARLRHEMAKAGLAELELAKERSQVVLAADVEARLVEVFTACKTKLLGVPARARQQDPGLSVAQLALLEDLIREALEDLAGAEAAP